MRRGFFGGAFDPIHMAHLRLAEEARMAASLEMVSFIPTHTAPHKQSAFAPYTDRVAMLTSAIDGNPHFDINQLEAGREGCSYTYDTLTVLRSRYPDDELFFIIGLDSYYDIPNWYRGDDLFNLASFIVVQRPGHLRPKSLIAALPEACRLRFVVEEEAILRCDNGNSIMFIAGAPMDIASRDIRHLIANNRSIRYLVPQSVADYIAQKGLYIS